MKLQKPFDPIEVGEIDNFAFDFSYNIGAAQIIGGQFTCSVAPNQSAVIDSNPQSHILSVTTPTIVATNIPPGAQLYNRPGNYVLAQVGNMASNSAGGTYILEATAFLNDGRVLALSSTVLCVNPGDF